MSLRATLQLPKEHGSWGMFFIPLALGLVAGGRWHWRAALFSVAATSAFLAREPFMSAWRNWRRKSESPRATSMVIVYGGVAVGLGLPLLPSYPWLAVLAGAGAALYAWHAEAAMRGEGRSGLAEILALATSMLCAPAAYYVSLGVLDWDAALLWIVCLAYFVSSVFYVKMRLTQARARDPRVVEKARHQCLEYHCVIAFAALALPPMIIAGFLPVLLRAFWYWARPTAEVNVKVVGWTEVVYSLVFFTTTAIGFHS